MLAAAELHRLAREGALLLVPNLRAARQLRSQLTAHSVFASTLPEAAQPTDALADRVVHWRAWTAALWREAILRGHDERVLLHPLQERLLWEQVLATDPLVETNDALLDLCTSATALLYQYNAVPALLADQHGNAAADASRFLSWFRTFQQRCYAEQLIAPAALESALATHAASLRSAAQPLVLCGLSGLAPAQQALLDAFANSGTPILHAPLQNRTGSAPVLLRCGDGTDELQALAQHLASALNSAQRPSIAVVVPDLSSARDRIERTLREYLHTSSSDPFTDDRRPLWEFSTGRPLPLIGAIADALHLLTWTTREIDGTEISRLLRSPHLDWPADAETAASLDAALLRRHPHLRGTWSPSSAARLLHRSSPALSNVLAERTRSWPALQHSTGRFQTFAERARHILRDFGWFRSGDRTSTEYQAVSRFEVLLDTVSSLDLLGGDLPTWSGFVQRLTTAARATSFARENTGAPIQFLTPDESTGVQAAELWVLHADEERWSSRAAPHPLLSHRLQHRHRMPGTDPALDHSRLQEQVERIAGIAPSSTFSYAHRSEAGEQRPSAAIAALPFLQFLDNEGDHTLATIHAAADLQAFQDGALIPLTPSALPVPGGVSTLQSQAACAFRAFAERRLGSTSLDSSDLGMDARDRGSLLHNALQLFWQSTGNSDALHRLIKDGRLRDAIHHAVELALRNHRNPNDRWTESYLDIQRERLERLLDRWLRMEAGRPRFTVVALEKEVVVTVGTLPLKVRVDRMDQVTLADGSKANVILDYKTGLPTAKKWEGDRPDEPQLPLYATAAIPLVAADDTRVGAIAFGVVRPGDKLDFVSAPKKSAWLSSDPKATSATLDNELQIWRNTLEEIAHEFASGLATVGPKEYPASCRFCDQRVLCRLNPALLDAEDAETDA